MRRCLLTLATAHALRPSMMLLPGASTGRITEDEARQRTSWPHWKPDEEKSPAVAPPPPATTPQKAWRRESDWTTDEEEPAVPPSPPTKPQAYTLAYFQDRVKARARKEALLGLVAATGRLCDAARGDNDVESELADVLRALTEVAAERDVPLDALARRIDS